MKRAMCLVMSIVMLFSFAVSANASGSGNDITSTEFDSTLPLPWEVNETEDPEDPLGLVIMNGSTEMLVEPKEELHPIVMSTTLPFSDVSSKDWFYSSVMFTYEQGILFGTTKTTFSPGASLTRAELVTLLFRLENLYRDRQNLKPLSVSGKAKFSDVSASSYYADSVTWATQQGIVYGVNDKEFKPNDLVTREQIAAIFYRYYSEYHGKDASTNYSLSQFTDSRSVGSYAVDSMKWAVGIGLISGTSSTVLNPKAEATRAQAASLAERLYTLLLCGGLPRASKQLIDFIKMREGFVATPYWDVSQYSIGYGTGCGKSRSEVPAAYWDGISESEADILLKTVLVESYEETVVQYEKRYDLSFTQQEFDALADFTYALGPLWAYDDCRLNRWLRNRGSDLELVWAFGTWCRVSSKVNPGTAQRRMREAMIFLYNDFSGTASNHPQYCYVVYNGNGAAISESGKSDDIGYYIKGQAYGALPYPSRSGYNFAGWYENDGTQISKKTVCSDNVTVYAHWYS